MTISAKKQSGDRAVKKAASWRKKSETAVAKAIIVGEKGMRLCGTRIREKTIFKTIKHQKTRRHQCFVKKSDEQLSCS